MAIEDKRRVPRADGEGMEQMNIQMPASLRAWVTLHATERNLSRTSNEKRVTISSVVRDLVELLRAEPDKVRELINELRERAGDTGGAD